MREPSSYSRTKAYPLRMQLATATWAASSTASSTRCGLLLSSHAETRLMQRCTGRRNRSCCQRRRLDWQRPSLHASLGSRVADERCWRCWWRVVLRDIKYERLTSFLLQASVSKLAVLRARRAEQGCLWKRRFLAGALPGPNIPSECADGF